MPIYSWVPNKIPLPNLYSLKILTNENRTYIIYSVKLHNVTAIFVL